MAKATLSLATKKKSLDFFCFFRPRERYGVARAAEMKTSNPAAKMVVYVKTVVTSPPTIALALVGCFC